MELLTKGMEFENLFPRCSLPSGARRGLKLLARQGLNCLLPLQLLSQGFSLDTFSQTFSTIRLSRDLTTSPASSYKPYLKFSVNAILARGEEGEEEEEERKPVLRRNTEEKEGLRRSPSPSLSPQPPPYSSSSPPLSPIVTQVSVADQKW